MLDFLQPQKKKPVIVGSGSTQCGSDPQSSVIAARKSDLDVFLRLPEWSWTVTGCSLDQQVLLPRLLLAHHFETASCHQRALSLLPSPFLEISPTGCLHHV